MSNDAYSVSIITPAAAAGAAYAVFRSTTTRRLRVKEVAFFNNAATASSVGLVRTATTGTASTTTAGIAHDMADVAGAGTVDSAWVAAATIGTNYFRRMVLPATAANGVIWTFSDPVIVDNSATGGLAIWNFGAALASALSLSVSWEE